MTTICNAVTKATPKNLKHHIITQSLIERSSREEILNT